MFCTPVQPVARIIMPLFFPSGCLILSGASYVRVSERVCTSGDIWGHLWTLPHWLVVDVSMSVSAHADANGVNVCVHGTNGSKLLFYLC